MSTAEITYMPSDNGSFTDDVFHDNCKMKNQTQSFSSVQARYQNAMA